MTTLPPEVAMFGMRLAELAAKNTATVVASRVEAALTGRDHKAQVAAMTDLVNDLVNDKAHLVLIGQQMNEQLLAQNIADEDIEFITVTLIPTLEDLMRSGSRDNDQEALGAQVEMIKKLVAPEMLRMLQLVGFNFRDAIGRPLTEVVASLIRKLVVAQPRVSQEELMHLELRRQLLELEVAKDGPASNRLPKVRTPPSESSRANSGMRK